MKPHWVAPRNTNLSSLRPTWDTDRRWFELAPDAPGHCSIPPGLPHQPRGEPALGQNVPSPQPGGSAGAVCYRVAPPCGSRGNAKHSFSTVMSLSAVDPQEEQLILYLRQLKPQPASTPGALDPCLYQPLCVLHCPPWAEQEWGEKGKPKAVVVVGGASQSSETAEMELFCQASDRKCCLWFAGEAERPGLGSCCAGTVV